MNRLAGERGLGVFPGRCFGVCVERFSSTPVPADVSAVANPACGMLPPTGRASWVAALSLSSPSVVEPLVADYPLLAIVGPTASGKSAVALKIAEELDVEVINYDSVQLFRGFDVGSAKLPAGERRGVPHHLLDCIDPARLFTAGDYRREALQVLVQVRSRGRLPVFVGGTGLYLRALLSGLFEGPARSDGLRRRLSAVADRRGREFLHRLLWRLDAPAAARIQPRDTQKLIRALEVCMLARQPMSALHARGRPALQGYRVIKIGLNPPRNELYRRINQRVEKMFASGLLDETRALLARPDAGRIKPLEALGYRQAVAALRGEIDLPKAICDTQVATRRYAKRQLTWFRRESDVTWFEGFGGDPDVQNRILVSLRRALGPSLEMRSENPACPSFQIPRRKNL
jgi:tRNA dimethylallyltransferase